MKKYKNKILAGVIIAIVLGLVFLYGGSAPGIRTSDLQNEKNTIVVKSDDTVNKETENEIKYEEPENNQVEPKNYTEQSKENNITVKTDENKNKYTTEPVLQDKPAPVEPENADIKDTEFSCTLSVRCDTILNNIGWLDGEKVDIIPKDGVIFSKKEVTFYEGESVFNLLVREMKLNKIHLEFESIPIYNSAYIDGIANIYEYDCGELSGWMYKVNGWFPNYGCSRYQIKDGDNIEWVYTCDLGKDVGGHYSARNGRI